MLCQTVTPTFSWNERFYINGERNKLLLRTVIRLEGRPHQPLDWKVPSLEEKGWILWHLDLGLFEEGFQIDHPLHHQARILALQEWMQKIYPSFQERTIGLILYQGKGLKEEEMEALSYHLSLFSYHLDDKVPIFLLFDMEHIPPDQVVHSLRPSLFSHYVLGLKGSSLPLSAFGWDQEGLFGIIGQGEIKGKEEKIGLLYSEGFYDFPHLYRLLYEEEAHASWDGLDVIVAKETTSLKAKRVLQGFQAAGGTVVIDGSFGLPGEIPLERFLKEIRGRGI